MTYVCRAGQHEGNGTGRTANMRKMKINQLDVTDIQGIMGISRASAYELVHTPGFPVVRSGRLIKISKKAFFNWLDSGGNFHEDEKEKTT